MVPSKVRLHYIQLYPKLTVFNFEVGPPRDGLLIIEFALKEGNMTIYNLVRCF